MQTVENTAAVATEESAMIDYQDNFMPAVHRIGQATMALAFCVSFLPVGYFVFIKGYAMPISAYLNVLLAIAAVGIGMWVTEPLAYWPVLGSAGTYISYLSGNVGGMRFPVATNVQSAMNADINTPRGQVATIVGIVASVFSNLVILLVIILAGTQILSIMPDPVKVALGFVMPCLYGSMIMMRFNPVRGGFKVGLPAFAPLLLVAMLTKVVIMNYLSFASTYATAIITGVTVLVAYIIYRVDLAKEGKAAGPA